MGLWHISKGLQRHILVWIKTRDDCISPYEMKLLSYC